MVLFTVPPIKKPGSQNPGLHITFFSNVVQRRLYHDGAFKAFFQQRARNIVRLHHISGVDLVVRVAAAAAIELREAIPAFSLFIHVRAGEEALHVKIEGLVKKISHLPFFQPDKLVAGINVALGRYGDIFVAAAAAAQALDRAGPVVEIEHKMEKVYG